MPIAIVPGLLVTVCPTGGDETIEHLGNIPLQSRFVLHHADGTRTPDVEHLYRTGLNARLLDNRCYLIRYIMHVLMPMRFDLDFLLINRHV